MTQPDIFTNVHRGIRCALFEACLALGRAGADREEGAAARRLLQEALHFTRHHGDNEDLLLIPVLRERAPAIAARMEEAHHGVGHALAALEASAADAPVDQLSFAAAAFLARYLEHMREEEQDLEPSIRAAVDADALAAFARGSVERTAPADQRMMIGWMLPAMPRAEAEALLGRLPSPLAKELRPLVATALPVPTG